MSKLFFKGIPLSQLATNKLTDPEIIGNITTEHDSTVTRTPLEDANVVNFDDMKVESTVDNLVNIFFVGSPLNHTADQRKMLIELAADSMTKLPSTVLDSGLSLDVKQELIRFACVLTEQKSEIHLRMRDNFYSNNWIEFQDPMTGYWLTAHGTSEEFSGNIELDSVLTIDTEMYSIDSMDIDLDFIGVESVKDVGLPLRKDRIDNDGINLINDFNFYSDLSSLSNDLLDESNVVKYAFTASRDAHVMFQDKQVIEKFDHVQPLDISTHNVFNQVDLSVQTMINEVSNRFGSGVVSPYTEHGTNALSDTLTEQVLAKIAKGVKVDMSANNPNLLLTEDNILQFLFSNDIFDRHRILWAR